MTKARVRGGYALNSALLLVHIAVYTLAEPRSSAFLVLAGLLTVFVTTGLVATLTFPRWLETARRWLVPAHLPYLLITLTLCFAFGVQARPEWLYVHAGLWIALTMSMGYVLLYRETRPVSPRLIAYATVISVPLILLVRLYGLTAYPSVHFTDEPWVLGWGINYAAAGQLYDRIMAFGGYEVTALAIPFGWWVSIMGTGFLQSRLFFFLCTLLLIGLTTLAARRLYDHRVAALTAVFMFASAVVTAGTRIRHDIGLALAVAASLWVYGEALHRKDRGLHAFAGLIIGLGVFVHYHAAIFGVVLALALYLPNWLAGKRWFADKGWRGWIPEPDFWAYVFGGVTAAMVFILLRLLPTQDDAVLARVVRLPDDPLHLIQMIGAYIDVIGQFSLFELALVVMSVAAALWRRSQIDVSLALAVLLMHIGLGIFAAAVLGDYYILPISPLYGILTAALFVRGLRRERDSRPQPSLRFRLVAGMSTACLIAGTTLAVPLTQLIERKPVELQPSPAVEWLQRHVEPNRTLVAQHWYYLFLTDYHFVSPYSTAYMSASERAAYANDEAVWDDINPDYVVIDPNFGDFCFAQVICQGDYLESRGYRIVAEFAGEREPIAIYASPQAGDPS